MTGLMFDLRKEARASMPRLPPVEGLVVPAISTWRGRMINEYSSSRVFGALANQMEDAMFPGTDIDQCRRFSAEERRHGVLCGSVVEALGGEARGQFREEEAFPVHEEVGPAEAVLRNVLSISCLSETVAVSLIGAERLEMPDGELKALLTEIWADEVGHARFGWKLVARHLDGFDAAARTRLVDYLSVAFLHLERHELAHLPDRPGPGRGSEALGLCSGREARDLFYATVEEVIVPRLGALGLDASAAWRSRSEAA